jgi:hypothetical protein
MDVDLGRDLLDPDGYAVLPEEVPCCPSNVLAVFCWSDVIVGRVLSISAVANRA